MGGDEEGGYHHLVQTVVGEEPTPRLSLDGYVMYRPFTSVIQGVAGYPEGHPNKISKVEGPEGLSESEKSRLCVERGESGGADN
jgi:hypothetical protein